MDRVYIKLARENWFAPEYKILDPEEAVNFIRNEIADLDREEVVAIYISASAQVIATSICSIGDLDSSTISMTGILREALLTGAHAILLMHNHPGGDCTPSDQDANATLKIAGACKMVGLTLLDHIIISPDDSYSFRLNQSQLFDTDVIDDLVAALSSIPV